MADVEVSYKGSTIGSLSASGSLTLETEGKYCEDDIGITYTSPGGGGGAYDPYGLPSGYTALKYIKSTGTQWIKTGVAPTLETKLQITGQRTVTSGYNALAGCSNPTIYIPMNNGVYSSRYYAKFGNSSEKNIDSPFPVGTALPPVITVDKSTATFETEGMEAKTVALGATAMDSPHANTRISLFGRYSGSTDTNAAITPGIILRAKIWDSGVLVADLVPAKRNSDDEIGMYDLASDTFYTNAGSGTFVGGEF